MLLSGPNFPSDQFHWVQNEKICPSELPACCISFTLSPLYSDNPTPNADHDQLVISLPDGQIIQSDKTVLLASGK
jgi:hypothetical protein